MVVVKFGLFLMLIVAPCVLAGWIASRLPWALMAFVVAWILTPLIALPATLILIPVIRATLPPGNDGTGVIMIPFYGIATGIVAGIVAAVLVSRRNRRLAAGQAAAATSQG